MKYLGSKARIAKYIIPIIVANRKEGQWYVEPFVGGANSIDKVDGYRIGNDSNELVIALLDALSKGYIPPEISKELYIRIRDNKSMYPKELVGWAGIGCSYSGKWFGGFAGKVKTLSGLVRDYQGEARKNLLKQADNLVGINFVAGSYQDLIIPDNSIIYCDPPYANTTRYSDNFDHREFWEWCELMVKKGHEVFVSEYSAPKGWTCVWGMQLNSSLSANGKIGGNKISTEKLFVFADEERSLR